MEPRQRVLQILRGQTASRIRFSFDTTSGRVTLARQTFNRVAVAIEHGKIGIHVLTPTELAAARAQNIGAYYLGSTNTLFVPPIIGRVDEGLLMHECVHAAYDILKTGITALDEESSAYVVDALYFRMTGVKRPRWNGEPHRTAGTVADGLLGDFQRGTAGIPLVGAQAWGILRLAVMVNPVYMFPNMAKGDFTLGLAATGGSYSHNG